MDVLIYTRHSREKIGLSQSKLAEISGVKQHALSLHEKGAKNLTAVQNQKILDVLSKTDLVREVIQRKKRRVTHDFTKVEDNSRARLYSETSRNNNFLSLINRTNDAQAGLNALSFFSGIGGFSLGFKQAGFKIIGNVEINEKVRKIYVKNFPESRCFASDITTLGKSISNILVQEKTEIDVIIGGPPCQGFSLSGKRDESDPRNSLFQDYCRQVELIRPKFAVMENVRRLTSMKDKNGLLVIDEITKKFDEIGYKVQKFEVNAANYGVPQNRERVFFIAVRNDLELNPFFPTITHSDKSSLFDIMEPQYTFGDAVSDLPFLESGQGSDVPFHTTVNHPNHVIKWLWNVSQGKSAHENEDLTLRPPSGYNTTYKRQVWDKPASTVQTTFSMISGCRNVHPIATRSLTVREAARIQTFPDDFKLVGTKGGISTGIGNAVPPLLARAIASTIKAYLV